MVDPRMAHSIDTGLLRSHLPRLDISDLYDIRREFANALATRQGRSAATWQEAWNAWTGATPHRPGTIRIFARCSQCSGRGFSHRNVSHNLSRTGSPYACGTCRGVPGRRIAKQIVATFIPVPDVAASAPDSMPGEGNS